VGAYYTGSVATLTAASSNEQVVPNPNIKVEGTGFSRILKITPIKQGNAKS